MSVSQEKFRYQVRLSIFYMCPRVLLTPRLGAWDVGRIAVDKVLVVTNGPDRRLTFANFDRHAADVVEELRTAPLGLRIRPSLKGAL